MKTISYINHNLLRLAHVNLLLKDSMNYNITIKNFFKFALVFIFLGTTLNAQSGQETLKKIQNKFKSVEDFSANFTQSASISTGKGSGSQSGKFFYKRENKFVVELKNSSIISNGKSVWNYNTKQKRVVINSFSDNPTSFSLENYIYEYPSKCEINSVAAVNGKDEVIELVPKSEDVDFVNAKIWKNSDDMISRIEVVDNSNIKHTIQLSSIKTDQGIPDSKFDFNPPKGIKIIDLR